MSTVLDYVSSTNSLTINDNGTVTNVAGTGIDNNFSVPQTFQAGISASGPTSLQAVSGTTGNFTGTVNVATATSLGQAANLSQVGSYNGNTGNLATSTLPDTIWGQSVQVQTGATITLPTMQATPGSKVVMYGKGPFTVTCSGSQFIYCPAIGATNTTGPTPISVSDGGWIEVTARSGGEFDISGGSLVTFQNTAPSFTHAVSSPAYSATNSSTLAGTSSGSVNMYMPDQGNGKIVILTFNAYENNTTTNQTINFPTPFLVDPLIIGNDTGLSGSVTTTVITINAPNNSTSYSGTLIVMGN